jgi:two-component system, OmpR family, response regulator VicR
VFDQRARVHTGGKETEMKLKIIYFDDQAENLECFKTVLHDQFEVIISEDCLIYEKLLQLHRPHALLIDLHMPQMDGLTLYKKIQQSEFYNKCPVLFISADQSDENSLLVHGCGAIDFLPRQISTEELKSRIKSQIKFYLKGTPVLELGNLQLDARNFVTYVDGKPVDLTLVEMRILSMLLRSIPDPVKKDEMLEKIWGSTLDGKMYVHLSNLGNKLSGWEFQISVKNESVLLIRH